MRAPDNLRRLFAWLREELGLEQAAVCRLLARLPLLLQMDTDTGGWWDGALGGEGQGRGWAGSAAWPPACLWSSAAHGT